MADVPLLLERLPECQYGVADYGTAEGISACGEPALWRASWDGGESWLYLCDRHTREVEEGEDA